MDDNEAAGRGPMLRRQTPYRDDRVNPQCNVLLAVTIDDDTEAAVGIGNQFAITGSVALKPQQ